MGWRPTGNPGLAVPAAGGTAVLAAASFQAGMQGALMDRLQAMTTFVRVVENGSFSGAARQLNVGQPAVSKTIAQLEDRLQVRLLLRSTHGLTPTEAGQRFYERAHRAIEEANEAELEARGAGAGGPRGGARPVGAAARFGGHHFRAAPCCAAPPGVPQSEPRS